MSARPKQYRHVRLSPETHLNFKRLAAYTNRSLVSLIDLVAVNSVQKHLDLMDEDEKARFLKCDIPFEEAQAIYRRSKNSAPAGANALQETAG
jgi:hypothetical protein